MVAGALPVGGQRVARPCQPAPGPGQGRRVCASGARDGGDGGGAVAFGGAQGGAPLSAGARAGTGAACGASGARDGGDGCGAVAFAGAESGAPLSAGARAGTGAACGASGARYAGDGGGAVALGFGFAPYLVLASHFGAFWKSALCVRDARCTLAEELEIRTSRRSLGLLQGGLRREQ